MTMFVLRSEMIGSKLDSYLLIVLRGSSKLRSC